MTDTHDRQDKKDHTTDGTGGPVSIRSARFGLPVLVITGLIGVVVGALGGAMFAGGDDGSGPSPAALASPIAFTYRALGESVTTDLGNEVTVFRFGPTALPPGSTAEQYSAWRADIEWCAAPSQTAVPVNGIVGRFFLLQANDEQRVPASLMQEAPPEYLSAAQGSIGPGDCVRGWIRFAAPPDAQPQYVSFAGASLVRWDVSGASPTAGPASGSPASPAGASPSP